MRIVDALVEVLKDSESLTYKEAYLKIVERNLYQFGAKDPEAAVNAKLRCHCEGLDFPGASPVKYFKIVGKKGTRNLYALVKEGQEDLIDTKLLSEEDLLPEEKIERTYLFYKSNIKKQILEHIMDCHPSFFEQLVVELLLEMGYGSDELSGRVLGKAHDGGIDGVIYEDKLGLSILNKITAQTSKNKFYSEYSKNCKNCDTKDICPICLNYQLLSDEKIQEGIISAIIENIVKNKLIVSTRKLLNMIYEIIVDERYWNRGSLEPRKIPWKMTSINYCKSLLPNILFEKKNSSEILDLMVTVDPMQVRNENIDDFFVYYENSDNITKIFKENLQEYIALLNKLKKLDFSDRSTHPIKEEILKIFVRLCWLTKVRSDLLPQDKEYEEYMQALYSWNAGRHLDLKNVYSIVEKGILAWNGQANQDEMQLSLRSKKSDFHLVQKIEMKKKVDNLPEQVQGELYSFRDELRLKYRYSDSCEAELDVDFSLYKLLKKVLNGYVPNINDKRLNVKCVEFINKISHGGAKMEKIYIRDLSQKNIKEYKLSYDEDYGYSFEVMD